MLRIGWFSPISSKTGISAYSKNVLQEMREIFPRDEVDVVIFYPPTDMPVVDMPYPAIELSESLLKSDFDALFDIAIYHVGNNAINHTPIYHALLKCPGLVVLHDYVYQHYLAGVGVRDHFISSSFASLIFEAGGIEAFNLLADSGVLRCDSGALSFVPWESEWSMQVPLGAQIARLGLGAVVHSDYSKAGLGENYGGDVCTLFMPRPEFSALPPVEVSPNGKIHLVCCGHIQATKGLRLLTGAFTRDPELRNNFRVTISGFGSDKVFLDLLRRELKEGDLDAVFDLVVDPSEIEYVEVMSSADVYVNLRYPNTEGASLSLYEQLCMGRPVISYRTGSFAEISSEACYFLEEIGDVREVSELLWQISQNRCEIGIRGRKARECVEDLTAGKYAVDLVSFLRSHQESFSRRTELFRARSKGVLPVPQALDANWFSQLVEAKRMMENFYKDDFVLPNTLLKSGDIEIGRFVALNLLENRMPAENMERIGKVLRNVSSLKAVEVLGLLLLFDGKDSYLPEYFKDVYLPIRDGIFWKIMVALPASRAIPFSMEALGLEVDPELINDLIQEANEKSVAQALHDFLKSVNSSLLRRADFADVLDVLEDVDSSALEALAPIPMGKNIIQMLAAQSKCASVLLQGFHPVESIGVWTAKHEAFIFLRVPESQSATALIGDVQFFQPGVVNGETLIVEVTEQASGRTKVLEMRYNPGDPTVMQWNLKLPAFEGGVKVMISTQKLYSPKAFGVSVDPRNLGVMCRDLRLVGR